MTLLVKLSFFNRDYFFVIKRLGRVLGSTNALTVNSIKEGSVILEGVAAPSGNPGSAKAAE